MSINDIKIWFARRLKSRTMRFNVIMSMLMALEGVYHLVQPLMSVNVYAITSIVLAMGNAYYREITTQALKDK